MEKLSSLALVLCLKPGNFNFMGQLFKNLIWIRMMRIPMFCYPGSDGFQSKIGLELQWSRYTLFHITISGLLMLYGAPWGQLFKSNLMGFRLFDWIKSWKWAVQKKKGFWNQIRSQNPILVLIWIKLSYLLLNWDTFDPKKIWIILIQHKGGF